jgi:hypothetical protein
MDTLDQFDIDAWVLDQQQGIGQDANIQPPQPAAAA